MRKILFFLGTLFISHFFCGQAIALEINAFGDITFSDNNKATGGGASGFSLGMLDLWGTQRIDSDGKMKAFIELVVESPAEGGWVVDLERLFVEYTPISAIKLRGGRFHTALGHWNQTHHHGAHMQTTATRPLFLDFEDGDFAALPSHMIGGMVDADYNVSGIGEINFQLQLANGSTVDTVKGEIDPLNSNDVDDNKSIAGRLVFHPSLVEGLGVGASYLTNGVREIGTGGVMTNLVDQKIFATELVYVENNVEFLLEYFWIDNKNEVPGTYQFGKNQLSAAYYIQAGYTFFEQLTPYVRYEALDLIDKNDQYFIKLGTKQYRQTVYGFRFDINNNSSIKLEGRNLTENVASDPHDHTDPTKNEAQSDSYFVQWTFAF